MKRLAALCALAFALSGAAQAGATRTVRDACPALRLRVTSAEPVFMRRTCRGNFGIRIWMNGRNPLNGFAYHNTVIAYGAASVVRIHQYDDSWVSIRVATSNPAAVEVRVRFERTS